MVHSESSETLINWWDHSHRGSITVYDIHGSFTYSIDKYLLKPTNSRSCSTFWEYSYDKTPSPYSDEDFILAEEGR